MFVGKTTIIHLIFNTLYNLTLYQLISNNYRSMECRIKLKKLSTIKLYIPVQYIKKIHVYNKL